MASVGGDVAGDNRNDSKVQSEKKWRVTRSEPLV
jgi:hypothetical protein